MSRSTPIAPDSRPLRIIASGTLFLTHTLSLPSLPSSSNTHDAGPTTTTARAHTVAHVRGGSAATLCSMMAQMPGVDAMLAAPLAGDDEGKVLIRDLRRENVNTRYCKVWDELGVPSAWVLVADDTGNRTIVNHNPLPDITHEDFIALLGPVLAPENYPPTFTPPTSPPLSATSPQSAQLSFPRSPAPFDWLHFEGRSAKTTLANMRGVDGLARERKWRGHCVFSLDVGRRPRQGVEALIPHADVIFVNRHYAQSHAQHFAHSPRAFLLSLANDSGAPPHAILAAYWGSEGAALLSVPTREYIQSSAWAPPLVPPPPPTSDERARGVGPGSVRAGSTFFAAGHTPSSSGAFTAAGLGGSGGSRPLSRSTGVSGAPNALHGGSGEGNGVAPPWADPAPDADDAAAQDAFVAGLIWALSRRLVPNPHLPWATVKQASSPLGSPREAEMDMGKWRLEECLKFATEMAGRKAHRRTAGWAGLAQEMRDAGWFES